MRSFRRSLNWVFMFGVLIWNSSKADVCDKWFADSKIKPGPSCLSQCVLIFTDLGTFSCPQGCPSYCKASYKSELLFQLSDLYVSLTPAERALSAENPKMSLDAYLLSLKAEKLCLKLYSSSERNDESDACRHYTWAALMSHDLGVEFASKVLVAHEQDSRQPEDERAMDLANNRAGLLAADELKKKESFSEASLLSRFKLALKSKELSILKSRKD